MAINEDEILHSSILSKNINSNDFIEFMKNLINNMDENKLNNSLFIFDNAKVHISKTTTNFLKDKNIKIITNVPYCSFFNSIELLFRAFKNIIYKECFTTIKELKKKVRNLITDKNMKNIIKKNLCETLNEYIKYFQKNIEKLNIDEIKKNFISKKRRRKKK